MMYDNLEEGELGYITKVKTKTSTSRAAVKSFAAHRLPGRNGGDGDGNGDGDGGGDSNGDSECDGVPTVTVSSTMTGM
jgi:hypothetical protein